MSRGNKIDLSQAIFLAIVQGLTEFLPVSSSGHLVFFQSLFGFREPAIFFDVMLHFGTLLAVLTFFRKDVWRIVVGTKAALRKKGEERDGAMLLFWIILATIPTGLMGFFLRDWFESFFARPAMVGIMFLVTGLVLWLTRWAGNGKRDVGNLGWLNALIVGISQGIAIIPGISRSGATISTGIFCGLNRELSGKFSFLLSVPAILGATALEFEKVDFSMNVGAVLIGTIVAFGVGILALTAFVKIIRMGKLSVFAYYCWGMGIFTILIAS